MWSVADQTGTRTCNLSSSTNETTNRHTCNRLFLCHSNSYPSSISPVRYCRRVGGRPTPAAAASCDSSKPTEHVCTQRTGAFQTIIAARRLYGWTEKPLNKLFSSVPGGMTINWTGPSVGSGPGKNRIPRCAGVCTNRVIKCSNLRRASCANAQDILLLFAQRRSKWANSDSVSRVDVVRMLGLTSRKWG